MKLEFYVVLFGHDCNVILIIRREDYITISFTGDCYYCILISPVNVYVLHLHCNTTYYCEWQVVFQNILWATSSGLKLVHSLFCIMSIITSNNKNCYWGFLFQFIIPPLLFTFRILLICIINVKFCKDGCIDECLLFFHAKIY